MLCAAKEEMPAPCAPPIVGSDEEIFSLAAAVAFVFETHHGENTVSGEKPHQGIFPKNRTIAVGATWVKWSETHWDSGTWRVETALGPTFYGYDGHGNTRFLANTAGTITDTYTFDAFGAQIATTGTTPNPYLYSGERFDSALNLYHLRARYYNMLTGRFETMDPGKCQSCCAPQASQSENIFDPGSLHKYIYTQNNPVNRVDPSGRDGVETATLYRFVLVYTAATVLYYALTERCAEAKAACIVQCTADVLEVPGGPTDRSGEFFKCMHRCMEAAGCE